MLSFINLKLKAFLIILITTVIVMSVSYVIIITHINQTSISRYASQLQVTTSQTAKIINQRFDSVLKQMNNMELNKEFQSTCHDNNNSYFVVNTVALNNMFQQNRNINNDLIDSIILKTSKGSTCFEYTVEKLSKSINVADAVWYDELTQNAPYIIWYPLHQRDILISENNRKVFSVIKSINDNSNNTLGIFIINLKNDFLINELNKIDDGIGGYYYLVDEQNRVISSVGMPPSDNYETNINENKNIYFKDKNLISYATINSSNWKLVSVIPKQVILKTQQSILNMIAISIVIGLCIALLLAFAFSTYFTKPMNKLAQIIKEVRQGDLNVRLGGDIPKDEIGEICHGFNDMLDNIEQLMQNIENEKNLNLKLSLKALEEQLNSHFLYNILDSIYFLAKTGDGGRAAEMTASLANFVRHSLNNGNELTTVEKELEHVQNYVNMEKIRYGNKINFTNNCDDSMKNIQLPKLLLQPLVENSINHGIFPKKSGNIKMNAYKSDDTIIFDVYDDGVGIPADKLEKINNILASDETLNSSEGFALQNIRNRLVLYYGADVKLSLQSIENEGCQTSLIIPLKDFASTTPFLHNISETKKTIVM